MEAVEGEEKIMTEQERKDYLKDRIIFGIIAGIIAPFAMAYSKLTGFFDTDNFIKYFIFTIVIFPIVNYLFGLWHLKKKSRK